MNTQKFIQCFVEKARSKGIDVEVVHNVSCLDYAKRDISAATNIAKSAMK